LYELFAITNTHNIIETAAEHAEMEETPMFGRERRQHRCLTGAAGVALFAFGARVFCAFAIVATMGLVPARAQQSFPIVVARVTQWSYGKGCDEPGGGLKAPERPGASSQLPKVCTWVNAQFTPLSAALPVPTITSPVSFVSPTARIDFQFLLELTDRDLSDASYKYDIAVTATDSTGNTVTASGSTTLYGTNARNVPSGAIKATNGHAGAILHIPLNVDSAVNLIGVSYGLSQGPVQPAPTPATGPFILAISPLAALQLKVLPVAIVYGPLGNQGKSTLTLSQTTGYSAQFTNSNTVSQTNSFDNKTVASLGVSLGWGTPSGPDQTTANGSVGFTASKTWDKTTQTTSSSSYGQTNSILTTTQLQTLIQVVQPSAALSVSNPAFGYFNQPFWSDLFLLAANPQYAIWDYPSSLNGVQWVPILQPLGNSAIIQFFVSELYQCVVTGAAANCSRPWQDSQGGAHTLVLTPSECAQLLNLDPFWVAKTQALSPSQIPSLFSSTANGNAVSPDTISISNNITVTTSNSSTQAFSATVTSVTANQEGVTGTLNIPAFPLGHLGITAGINTTTTTSQSGTNAVSYQTVQGSSLANGNVGQTLIQDSCMTASTRCSIPFTAFVDKAFLGMAVTDSAMKYPVPPNTNLLPKQVLAAIKVTPPTAQQRSAAAAQAKQEYLAAATRHIKAVVPKPAPASVEQPSAAVEAQLIKQLSAQPPPH
jgi:hypothetical protein